MQLTDSRSSLLGSALESFYGRLSRIMSAAGAGLSGNGIQMVLESPVDEVGGRHRFDSSDPQNPSRMSETSDSMSGVSVVAGDNLLRDLSLNQPLDLSSVRRRQRDKALALLQDEALLEAAYSFSVVALSGRTGEGALRVGVETLRVPTNCLKQRYQVALGCGACTLGPLFAVRVRQLLTEKRGALALALEALGNEILSSLGQRMHAELEAVVRNRGLILGQRLACNDSELDRASRAALLRLVRAGEIGITLQGDNPRQPHHSTIQLCAVGRKRPRLSLSR
ncbi:MAG: hypothetical protein P8045_14970 [Candidatus Thiodiazotropha sp.]